MTTECWCGTLDTDYAKHGKSTACDHECLGHLDVTCGGYYAANVHAYESENTPTASAHLGCFEDQKPSVTVSWTSFALSDDSMTQETGKTDRIMVLALSDGDTMTREVCGAECRGRCLKACEECAGNIYFGLHKHPTTLGDATATNTEECAEYVTGVLATGGDIGLFSHDSEHKSFQILTPIGRIRLNHGRLQELPRRDPTGRFDLPKHVTWQMNFAIDHKDLDVSVARGILGETLVPTMDGNGKPIMEGMDSIRGSQEDYRVDPKGHISPETFATDN
eukprot:g15706.t1